MASSPNAPTGSDSNAQSTNAPQGSAAASGTPASTGSPQGAAATPGSGPTTPPPAGGVAQQQNAAGPESMQPFLDIKDDQKTAETVGSNLNRLKNDVRTKINEVLEKTGKHVFVTGVSMDGGKPHIIESLTWSELQEVVNKFSKMGTENFRRQIYGVLQESVTAYNGRLAAEKEEEKVVEPAETKTPDRDSPPASESSASATSSDGQKKRGWFGRKWDAWETFFGKLNKGLEENVFGQGRKIAGNDPDTFNFFRSGFWLWRKLGIFQGGGGAAGRH